MTAVANRKIPGEAGIWIFIAGDLIVFSVFFILIATGQSTQTTLFNEARSTLNVTTGLINTLLLLTGSWFAAIAVEKCKTTNTNNAAAYFTWAIICGAGFVINKALEWGTKINSGLSPASNDFYMYFFVFTGIHLIHVVIGIGVLLIIRAISRRPKLNRQDIRGIECGALFWHIVDLLWVVLFALLYLL